MKRKWFKHFMHDQMFVFKKEEDIQTNNCSGWDAKGNKFENEFHFIDNRYLKITDPEQIELLDLEFDKS